MAVSNKKAAMAWKAVNNVSRRKKSNKAKIKAISGEERIIVWHNHFKYLLGNPPKRNRLNIKTAIFYKV